MGFHTPVSAQQSTLGIITGAIVDTLTKRPVVSATVALVEPGGARNEIAADPSGKYTFSDIAPGPYVIEVSANGYVRAAEINIRSVPGDTTIADFALARNYGEIDEITVVANAASADPFADAGSRSLSREEIRRNPGTAGDVFRGLDTLPGVASTGEFSNFTVRSRDPKDNLILIDNIPFDQVVHFERVFGDEAQIAGGGRFSIFAPNLIGDAEFQPAGWSSAYGGRNASLLKLNLAEGNRESPSLNARVDIAGGELTYDGPSYLLENTSVLVSARYFNFENLFKLIDQKDIGAPSLTDIVFKSTTRFNPSNKLNLIAIHATENFDRDVTNVVESTNFDDASVVNAEQDVTLVGATWEHLSGATGRWVNTVYYRHSDKAEIVGEAFPDLAASDPGALPDPENVTVRENILSFSAAERELGWRSDYSVETGLGVLTAGVRITRLELEYDRAVENDFVRFVYDSDDFRPDPSQEFIVLTPGRYNNFYRQNKTDFAGFVEHAFVFGNYTIRPGVRVARDALTDETLVSPRLAATWQATRDTRLSLSGGIFYQRPRFLDLSANPANESLKNEKVTQINFGMTHALASGLTLFAESYYHSFDRVIVRTDATNGAAENVGDGHSYGVDVALNRQLADGWLGSLSYSYAQARQDNNFGFGAYDADYHRPHVFGASISWNISSAWTIGAKWKYLSGRPADSFIVNQDVLNDPNLPRFSKQIIGENDIRVRDYHSLNIRVDYEKRIGGVTVIAFLDVINAYGRSNIDRLRFNERRGTNVDTTFGVFPQIGLKFRF